MAVPARMARRGRSRSGHSRLMLRLLHYAGAVAAGLLLGLGSALWLAGPWPQGRSRAFGDVDVWTVGAAILHRIASSRSLHPRPGRPPWAAGAGQERGGLSHPQHRFRRGTLSNHCHYRLSGGPMSAGWWSVTLYDAQSMLPANTDNALSIDAGRAGQGAWGTGIAPQPPDDGSVWISSRGGRPSTSC